MRPFPPTSLAVPNRPQMTTPPGWAAQDGPERGTPGHHGGRGCRQCLIKTSSMSASTCASTSAVTCQTIPQNIFANRFIIVASGGAKSAPRQDARHTNGSVARCYQPRLLTSWRKHVMASGRQDVKVATETSYGVLSAVTRGLRQCFSTLPANGHLPVSLTGAVRCPISTSTPTAARPKGCCAENSVAITAHGSLRAHPNGGANCI